MYAKKFDFIFSIPFANNINIGGTSAMLSLISYSPVAYKQNKNMKNVMTKEIKILILDLVKLIFFKKNNIVTGINKIIGANNVWENKNKLLSNLLKKIDIPWLNAWSIHIKWFP